MTDSIIGDSELLSLPDGKGCSEGGCAMMVVLIVFCLFFIGLILLLRYV